MLLLAKDNEKKNSFLFFNDKIISVCFYDNKISIKKKEECEWKKCKYNELIKNIMIILEYEKKDVYEMMEVVLKQ